ncbi:unnamed protein product, partial [Ectocarpus sp. 13 AM-2016]
EARAGHGGRRDHGPLACRRYFRREPSSGADSVPHLRGPDRLGNHFHHPSGAGQDPQDQHRHRHGPRVRDGDLFHVPPSGA